MEQFLGASKLLDREMQENMQFKISNIYQIYGFILRNQHRFYKILLLTGTPIIQDPFELSIIFNLLRKDIFSSQR